MEFNSYITSITKTPNYSCCLLFVAYLQLLFLAKKTQSGNNGYIMCLTYLKTGKHHSVRKRCVLWDLKLLTFDQK